MLFRTRNLQLVSALQGLDEVGIVSDLSDAWK